MLDVNELVMIILVHYTKTKGNMRTVYKARHCIYIVNCIYTKRTFSESFNQTKIWVLLNLLHGTGILLVSTFFAFS